MKLSRPISPAKRLCIYISESDRWRSQSLHVALLAVLKDQGIAGATLYRGMAGFGAHSRLQSTALEVLSIDLPIVLEAVDSAKKIEAVLDTLYPMVREGLITLEDVSIIKYTHRLLNPLPVDRLVSECMTAEVIAFSPDQSVGQAWKIMLQNQIKSAPIINAQSRVVGIITDQDLLERAGIQQRLSIAIRLPQESVQLELQELEKSTLKLQDVMSQPVHTLYDHDPLAKAIPLMTRHSLKRLPVVNKENKLVGVLSRLDVLRQVMDLPAADETAHNPENTGKTIGEIMQTPIPMVEQSADIAAIIQTMTAHQSHRLIVVNDQGQAVGLISDSDLFARIQPQKHAGILAALRKRASAPFGDETALDLMSPEPLQAAPDLPIVDAVKLLLGASRKWLLVVDARKIPLGLVDRQALLLALAPESPPQI
jgi:CBS domain-containing protein